MKRYLKTVALTGVFFLSGCYTQLGTLKSTTADIPEVVDSKGDTIKQNVQVDTIVVKERQNCVWERDMWGYPRLHCYDTYFPQEWSYYSNTPWWFRNDPYWFDYKRCPRFYYYDKSCGSCRHYQYRSYYHSGNAGSGNHDHNSNNGSTPTSTGAPSRTRSGGLNTEPSNNPMSKSAQQQSVPVAPVQTEPLHRERSEGVPDAHSAVPVQHTDQGYQNKRVSGWEGGTGESLIQKDTSAIDRYKTRRSSRSW